ncbi:MAG: septum formation initiator family protein [Patescibacteria group bacterium]
MNKQRKIIILIELVLIAFLSFNFIRDRIKNRPIRSELNGLRRELEKLQDENENLKQRLIYLQNPENKKKEMRDKLNLSEPGEKMLILPEGY